MRFGFAGGAQYQGQTFLSDAEACINFFPEKNESPNSRTAWSLLPTGGLQLFAKTPVAVASIRGEYTINGRGFFVGGTHLFEVTAGAVVTDYGGFGTLNNNMIDDGLPVTIVGGGTASGSYPGQLLIASGGTLTAFNLVTNGYVAITGAPGSVVMIDYLDGFFIALQSTNTWQVSNPEDCTTWTGLAISQISVYSDQLLSLVASNRLLWIFGAKRGVAYYTSGAPIFPFDVVNGGFVEVGIAAQFSLVRVATAGGTTIAWLSADERGGYTAYTMNGFTPQRISDRSLEYWMSQQTSVSDAIAWAESYLGHNFYVLRFPTANATWAYDLDLGFWHRRSSTIAGQGAQQATRYRCHMFAFNQHLVGDYATGNIYAMSPAYYSDNVGMTTFPIVRQRISPHISNEYEWLFCDEFQLDLETGLGPQPPLTDGLGNPRDPYAMVSYSKDFAKTWSNEVAIPCGQAGNFRTRAILRRLGKARQWTFRVTMSDPIAWRITDALFNPTEQGQERLAKIYAKMG